MSGVPKCDQDEKLPVQSYLREPFGRTELKNKGFIYLTPYIYIHGIIYRLQVKRNYDTDKSVSVSLIFERKCLLHRNLSFQNLLSFILEPINFFIQTSILLFENKFRKNPISWLLDKTQYILWSYDWAIFEIAKRRMIRNGFFFFRKIQISFAKISLFVIIIEIFK